MAKKALEKASTDELQAELVRRERTAKRLVNKREKLLSQIADIDAELADFGYEPTEPAPRGRRRVAGGRRAGGGRKRPKNEMSLVEVLAKALKGKTMGVSEAAEAAERMGYQSSSANFRNIVNQTLLKHDDTFEKVGRGQYTAK